MSDPILQKLKSANVDPSLKNFHKGAVGSVQMLSMGFYGLIEAFQTQMQKTEMFETKIDQMNMRMSNMANELSESKQLLNEATEK